MKILAIDLGKRTSVACVYDADSGKTPFRKMPTSPETLQQVIQFAKPDRVVIEICSSAGWVSDLVTEMGIEVQIANTSAAARRRTNTKGRPTAMTRCV